MKQYLNLCKTVLEKGKYKEDRTGTGTYSLFGHQERYDLSDGFPLLTTKRVHLKSIIHELLWFIEGDTNIKYLVDNDVNIWNAWPYEIFKKSDEWGGQDMNAFVFMIKTSEYMAKKYGDLGPVYGAQWRNFHGVDQLSWVINEIKTNPDSRRLIVNSWDASKIKDMALPPCHMMFQFYVNDGKLSLQLYQRSADVFLGVPFNIASYALLLMMVAQVTNLKAGEFIHTIGDAHIYSNHIDQVNLQLSRETRKLPIMTLNPEIKSIFDFKFDDFVLNDYNPHKGIKGKVAV